MKRIFPILTAVLMVVLLAGCGDVKQKLSKKANLKPLRDEVEKLQKLLPMSIGMAGTFADADLDEDEMALELTFVMNEGILNVDKMKGHEDVFKTNFEMVMTQSDDTKALIEVCAESAVKLKIVYKGNVSGAKAYITFDNDELQQMLKSDSSVSPQILLKQQIDVTKVQLPMQVDALTILQDVYLDDGDFVYEYIIMESDELTMDDVDFSVLRPNLLTNLRSSDPSIHQLVDLCKQCDADIIYRYIGDRSGKKVEIEFGIEEL